MGRRPYAIQPDRRHDAVVLGERTVLIVDDDAAVRLLIRSVLEDAGFTIAGEAENGSEAVARAAELRPAVITMDLEMPVLDGVAATERICASGAAAVVIVSGSASSELIGQALAAGARWHVAKRDITKQLVYVLSAI